MSQSNVQRFRRGGSVRPPSGGNNNPTPAPKDPAPKAPAPKAPATQTPSGGTPRPRSGTPSPSNTPAKKATPVAQQANAILAGKKNITQATKGLTQTQKAAVYNRVVQGAIDRGNQGLADRAMGRLQTQANKIIDPNLQQRYSKDTEKLFNLTKQQKNIMKYFDFAKGRMTPTQTTLANPTIITPKPGDDPRSEPEIDIPIQSYSYSTEVPKQTLAPGRDVINFATDPASVEAMQQLLFEQLSSFEIVNMARGDTIEGLNPYYSVISNLSSLRRQYDPAQIVSLQTPIQTISDIYQISLTDKIPEKDEFFYIDLNGDFIIELDNIADDEIIEIQVATSGKII